ncbi:MAG TPA: DUF1761 domain-containing protein, partial [bacterium]
IGGLWYSPFLFGNAWAAELKLSKRKIKNSNLFVIFGSAFILTWIGAVVLDLLIGTEATLLSGLLAGLFVGAAFIATSFGVNFVFSRKSFKLFLIDAGYFVVCYSVMGAILGLW